MTKAFAATASALFFSAALLARSPQPLAVDLFPHPAGTAMMTVHAKIAGHEGNFLLDTGGGISYVSPSFAEKIGCSPWGQISGFTLIGSRIDMQRCDDVTFDVAGRSFHAPIAGVFDLMKLMPAEVPQIDGSIALDVFAKEAITLSLHDRKLIIENARSLAKRAAAATPIPIRLARDAQGLALTVVIPIATPRGMAWMEVDSGNGGAFVIGKHVAPLLGIDADKKGPQPISMRIDGRVPVEGMARVNDTLIMDGNIGTPYLVHADLTLDLANGRAWVSEIAK